MAIVLTKKKIVALDKPAFETTTPSDLVELIDAVGTAQDEVLKKVALIKQLQAEIKPHAERVKELVALVTKFYVDQGKDPTAIGIEETENFILEVGKATTVRTVKDLELAMKKLGKKVFFEKATIGLGVLDHYLTPEERSQVLDIVNDVRSVKITPRTEIKSQAA